MKRLLVCCDGTWNTPDQSDQGRPTPTNVFKLYAAATEGAVNGAVQLRYYHPGVGTGDSRTDKLLGGGLGLGLERNIKSAYRNLCDSYTSGDDIFLIGFSRGAYTVRSLGGFITRCGLINLSGLKEPEVWRRIDTAFRAGYRKQRDDWNTEDWPRVDGPKGPATIPIRFVGVWDTVGALGVPDNFALLNLIDAQKDYSFHDTELGPCVQTARHAVALDEMRASFQTTLWTGVPADRDVKQVWFPGVHSDVGGGYPETELSDGALLWMIRQAEECGLVFEEHMVEQIQPNHHGILHDSLTGVFASLPTQPRPAPPLDGDSDLHKSSAERHLKPPITQAPYRSTRRLAEAGDSLTVDVFARDPWNYTGIWLEQGVSYELTATGEWQDKNISCGPSGASDGRFHPSEIFHVIGTGLGKLERLFAGLTGNEQADFIGTRRHEDIPWFCLTGAIANSAGVVANRTMSHQIFEIGDNKTVVPKKAGYLYAYANDAWLFYENNRGKVRLTVKRL